VQLSNSFTVDVPVERAWEVLNDVPTIAPCLPGAQLQEVEGEEYRGVVKVKVGPITAQYKGKATFVERDESAHRVVLKAEGRDTRGQGNASALITAEMRPAGESTEVVVSTDLTVTGKVAQFGRGVMADVSAKLMGQFADNLAGTVLSGDQSPPAAIEPGPTPAGAIDPGPEPAGEIAGSQPAEDASVADEPPRVQRFDMPEPEPVDLLGTAGSPALKRIVPPVVVALLILLVIRMLRRRGRD
jgi:uncharacterized protein